VTTIKGFDDDVTIVHIGDFFRYNNVSYWSIGLWCSPVQEKKHTRLSNLPLLSRGKQLKGRKTSRRIDRVFTFESGYQLHDCKLSEFPELSTYDSVKTKDGLQNAFYFEELWETIVLPQLELARAIFLVNSYLCRACLSSESLSLEFDVQPVPEDNHVNIHVLKTSTFPKTAFDQSGTKQLLAWLLTDPSALSSYQSIYRHFQAKHEIKGALESWCFSFEPPPMTNWRLHVRGRYDHSKTHYLIEEIIGIEFDVKMPATVAFINPDFVKKESSEEGARSGNGGTHWQSNDEEFVVDDEQSASDKNETLVLEDDLSWVRFKNICDVYKQERVQDTNKLIIDEFAEKQASREVSTDEPYQGGTLPSADVGGKQDVTDRERQFASRFQSFDHMLQVLQVKHQCSILDQDTQSLPKVGRSVQHQLSGGSPRAIKAVRLRHKSVEVVLLEVDTSDGIKMLSTKMIFGVDDRDWAKQFAQIRKGVVSQSISWPNKLLDDLFDEHNHVGINHPKHQGAEIGNILQESLEGWAFRIYHGINMR